jgi:hypothetical protein
MRTYRLSRTPLFVAVLLAVACRADSVAAQVGATSVWWDACAASATPAANSNKVWAGPIIYRQVLSATGADNICKGWDISIQIETIANASFPDAWRFDPVGCNDSQLSFTTLPVSLSLCPSFQGSQPISICQYWFNTAPAGPNQALLRAQSIFMPFDPVAAKEYTVFQLRYDLAFAELGPGNSPFTCGGAETGLSFRVVEQKLLEGDDEIVDWPVAHDRITWMGADPVPTVPSTWGRIKATYR